MPTPRVTIDQLPEQAAPEDANLLVVHDGDTTKKMSIATLKTIETAGLSVHIADPTGAHAATAISATDSGSGVNGVDVQAQLGQLAGRADAANAGLAAHLADTIDVHDASAISAVPHTGVSATDVQGQLEQLSTALSVKDVMWVGVDAPADPAVEVWYDPDEPVGSVPEPPYIDVRNHGATGNGTTDDTAAINAAIVAGAGQTVIAPRSAAGSTYLIDATVNAGTGIQLNQPGTRLLIEPGVTIKVKPNAAGSYAAIRVTAADCVIEGGHILGDVGTHTGSTGEWGHGIVVDAGGDRCRIAAIKISRCWGDGICVQGGPADLRIIDVRCVANRRQGLSITNCSRTQVIGGHFVDTGTVASTGPGAGIDIEPDPGVGNVTDLVICGATLTGNVGGGFIASTNGKIVTGVVSSCVARGNGQMGFLTAGANNHLQFIGCTAASSAIDGWSILDGTVGVMLTSCVGRGNIGAGFNIGADDVVLSDPISELNGRHGIWIAAIADRTAIIGGRSIANSQQTNSSYQNVNVEGTNSRIVGHVSAAGTLANKPGYGFADRSGASGNRYVHCETTGTFAAAPFLNQSGAAEFIRQGSGATASRPTPAAASKGGQFYDTTLNKPIWSDGTAWRDAAGTAV